MSAILKFPQRATTNPLPEKQQLLDTLKSAPNPLSDVFLAAHFDTSCPIVRSLLHELEAEGAVVSDDGEWSIKEQPVVVIDPEFKKLIPPLSREERSQLEENILAEGCRDPLVIWQGHNILLDGHNRFEICDQYGVEFYTTEIELNNREEAIIWILRNQLGRRNLSPDKASYFRGVLYNTLKSQGKRTDLTSGQFDQKWTAQTISEQLGVSEKTVRRDAKYADNLEQIAAHVGDKARSAILGGETKLTKKDVEAIADAAEKDPQRVKAAFKQAQGKDIVQRIKERTPVPFPYHKGDICCLRAKGEPSLRKYSGCWGVILEVGEFSARVGVWHGEIEAVKPENLSEYSYSPEQKTEMAKIRERLVRLRVAIIAAPRLEKTGLAILREIGLKQDPYLTELEEKLVRTLEAEYLRGED